jgi:hypothetical protein
MVSITSRRLAPVILRSIFASRSPALGSWARAGPMTMASSLTCQLQSRLSQIAVSSRDAGERRRLVARQLAYRHQQQRLPLVARQPADCGQRALEVLPGERSALRVRFGMAAVAVGERREGRQQAAPGQGAEQAAAGHGEGEAAGLVGRT